MQLNRRAMLAAAAMLAAGQRPALAADAPMKLVVGFPPGGTTDVIARLVANELGARLHRTMIVENRAGASGNIAAAQVAKSDADGNTLLMVPSSHATNASLYRNLPFDTEKDFAAIGMVATTPYVLVTNPRLPVNSVQELIAFLKAQPGRIEYASASVGTGQHLAAELFKTMAGVDMKHIPYKGSAAAYPDLIGGRVSLMFDNIALVVPHIRSGALKALAITSQKRSPLLPEIPTVAETLPGYEVEGWFAVLAPGKTPASTVRELNAALNAVVRQPGFTHHLSELGAEPMTGSPQAANAFIQKEIARWRDVIQAAKISLD